MEKWNKVRSEFLAAVFIGLMVAFFLGTQFPQATPFWGGRKAHGQLEGEFPEKDMWAYLEQIQKAGVSGCDYSYGGLIGRFEIPRQMISTRLCLEAVAKCPVSFRACPREVVTREVLVAYARHGGLPDFYRQQEFKESLIDAELAQIAVESGAHWLNLPPDCKADRELAGIAVEKDTNNFGWLDPILVDEELAWIKVVRDGSLKDVPERLITPALARYTVGRDPQALCNMPEQVHSRGLYRLAVIRDGITLGCVPFRRRSVELCRLALTNGNEAWDAVPHKYFLPQADGKRGLLADLFPH